MDWLQNINLNTTVLVPTRGLQSTLAKHFANYQMASGAVAWETPNIVVWDDYLDKLWQANKHVLDLPLMRLNTEQAFLIWQQIILKSKRDDEELTLLNEQQTANVVQRSWKLLHKWRVELADIESNDDIDSTMFVKWVEDYKARLQDKRWIDPAQLEHLIVERTADLVGLPKKLVFAYFDLVTANQTAHQNACLKLGVEIEHHALEEQAQSKHYQVYSHKQHELVDVFQSARSRLEKEPNARIGIVIPTLGEQRNQVEQLANEVFYPNYSPLTAQQSDLAYRFSLGHALSDVPYIRAMLTALALMKPRFRYQEISFLLRCHWWPYQSQHLSDVIVLERLLKNTRSTWWTWQEVITLWQQHNPESSTFVAEFSTLMEFSNNLSQKTDEHSSALVCSAQVWQTTFAEWLALLGWQENDLDSYHYQVHESWLSVLETFAKYDVVQMPIGLNRALMQLNSLCQDKVFMRQALDEPILISGVLEAIGQPVDYLYVTGMDETYPVPLKPDPFVPRASLAVQKYPFAEKTAEFNYEREKMRSLLSGNAQLVISYAKEHKDGTYLPSPLFRDQTFQTVEIKQVENVGVTVLEEYLDVEGKECQHSAGIKGGAKVFENQSKCPFKAYVEHRILRHQEREPEFGLDARDAGVVVHALLENIWKELGSDSQLRLESTDINALATRHVDAYLAAPSKSFQYDRKQLLQLERSRLITLVQEWLQLEKDQRISGFRVIDVESRIKSQFGGIPVELVIDRIDQLDNGEQIIIDYKTGQASAADWKKERMANPQLPLYVLALEAKQFEQVSYNIKGVAFGRVKQNDSELVGFANSTDIAQHIKLPIADRKKITWEQQLALWHENLSALAKQFIAGYAAVDPVKNDTCKHCELSSVCRVHALRAQGGLSDLEA